MTIFCGVYLRAARVTKMVQVVGLRLLVSFGFSITQQGGLGAQCAPHISGTRCAHTVGLFCYICFPFHRGLVWRDVNLADFTPGFLIRLWS